MNVNLKPFDFAQAAACAGPVGNGQPLEISRRRSRVAGFQAGDDPGAGLGEQRAEPGHGAAARGAASTTRTSAWKRRWSLDAEGADRFQATLTVRNRLVSAYSEIMNMQVSGLLCHELRPATAPSRKGGALRQAPAIARAGSAGTEMAALHQVTVVPVDPDQRCRRGRRPVLRCPKTCRKSSDSRRGRRQRRGSRSDALLGRIPRDRSWRHPIGELWRVKLPRL